MQSNAKIVLQVVTDAEEAKKQAKNIGKDVAKNVEKGANNIKFGDKIKGQLDKLKKGLDAVGVSAGGLSKIGNLFKGGGWIGLVAAGVAMLAQQAIQLWDHLTVTADELIRRGQSIKKTAKEGLDTAFKNEGNTQGYIQRLRELNAIENKSNLEKMQAIAIIQELTKVYGELGLSISTATGRVLGLDKALREIERRNRQMKGREAEKVTQGARQTAQGHLRKVLSNQTKLNEEYDIVATGGFSGSIVHLSEEEKQRRRKFNKSTQGKIDYLTEKRNKATTEKDIAELDAAIQALKALQKAQQEQQNIKKFGFRTQKQYLDMLKQENSQIRKNREQAKKRAKEYDKQRDAKQEREFYASLTPASTKKAYQQVRLQKRQSEMIQLAGKVQDLQFQKRSAQVELQDAQKSGDVTRIKDAYARLNKIVTELSKAEEEVRKKHTQIEDIQLQINRLTRQQTEEDLRRLKTDEQRIEKLKKMIELEKKREQTAQGVKKTATGSKERSTQAKQDAEASVRSIKAQRAQILSQWESFSDFKIQYDLQSQIQNLKLAMQAAKEAGNSTLFADLSKQLEQAQQKLQQIQAKTKGGLIKLVVDTAQTDLQDQIKKIKKAMKEAQDADKQPLYKDLQRQLEEAQRKLQDFQSKAQGLLTFDDVKIQMDLQEQVKIIKKAMQAAKEAGDDTGYKYLQRQLKEASRKLEQAQSRTQGNITRGMEGVDTSNLDENTKKQLQQILYLQKRILALDQKIKQNKDSMTGADLAIAQAEKQALQAKMRQLQMQKQIEEMQKRAKDYYDDRKSDLDAEYAIQHALLKGMYDLAEQTKIINELKKQGIIVDQKQIDAIKQKQALLKGVSVDRSLKQQGYSILDKVGAKDKNYQYERRIRELEEANGVSLTQTQKDKVKTLVDLQFKLDDLQKIKPDFSELQIKTNELTARGGFAGGAVMPDIEAIDKQIMDYQARSTTLLNDIKNILRQGGVI